MCENHAVDDKSLIRRAIMRLYGQWMDDTLGFYLFLGKASQIPIIGPIIKFFATQYGKYFHGGHVATVDECLSILDGASQISVIDCACRKKVKGCNNPLETCIMVNTGAEVFSDLKNRQIITAKRAKEIIMDSGHLGMIRAVHHCIAPHTYSLCNCCTCCCVPYKLRKEYGIKTALISGNYAAEIDRGKCRKCKRCLSICPEKAIDLSSGIVDAEKCIGCGLCVSSCKSEALQMVKKDQKIKKVEKPLGIDGSILMYTAFFLGIFPLAVLYKLLKKLSEI